MPITSKLALHRLALESWELVYKPPPPAFRPRNSLFLRNRGR